MRRLVVLLSIALAAGARAQGSTAGTPPPKADAPRPASRPSAARYWSTVAAGFAASVLAHEGGHVAASWAVGGHPSFGFDAVGRPTVYSGIDARRDPHKQFVFSAAGLTVQTLLDETLLDLPHPRGARAGAFERGLVAGGLGTVLFYTTIGRNGQVSDVDFMARTSRLTKGEVSLIYGGIAALHAVRVWHAPRYARFFARPSPEGIVVGVAR